MNRIALVCSILFCIAICCGCGDGPPPTPAERFDQQHGGKTVTTHGAVVKGSAEDAADGSVEYMTSEGGVETKWKVTEGSGGGWGEPQKVRPSATSN